MLDPKGDLLPVAYGLALPCRLPLPDQNKRMAVAPRPNHSPLRAPEKRRLVLNLADPEQQTQDPKFLSKELPWKCESDASFERNT